MKQFKIKPEYFDNWFVSDFDPDYVVDMAEVERLAIEWDTTVEELLEQLVEI